MQNSGMYTVPEDLNKELEHIYLSKFFFSVDAASIEGGYTLTDMNALDIIKAISSRCNETVMCIDSKKFDRRSFIRLGESDLYVHCGDQQPYSAGIPPVLH